MIQYDILISQGMFRMINLPKTKYSINVIGKYWTGVKRATSLVNCSQSSAKRMEKEENETVNALASLSVRVVQQNGTQAATTTASATSSSTSSNTADEKRSVDFISFIW